MILATFIATFASGAFAGLMAGAALSRVRGAANRNAISINAAISIGLAAVAVCLVFASA